MDFKDEIEKNLKTLREIRDDPANAGAVRIQAIQTMTKIMSDAGASAAPEKLTESDIMKKIRGKK